MNPTTLRSRGMRRPRSAATRRMAMAMASVWAKMALAIGNEVPAPSMFTRSVALMRAP